MEGSSKAFDTWILPSSVAPYQRTGNPAAVVALWEGVGVAPIATGTPSTRFSRPQVISSISGGAPGMPSALAAQVSKVSGENQVVEISDAQTGRTISRFTLPAGFGDLSFEERVLVGYPLERGALAVYDARVGRAASLSIKDAHCLGYVSSEEEREVPEGESSASLCYRGVDWEETGPGNWGAQLLKAHGEEPALHAPPPKEEGLAARSCSSERVDCGYLTPLPSQGLGALVPFCEGYLFRLLCIVSVALVVSFVSLNVLAL